MIILRRTIKINKQCKNCGKEFKVFPYKIREGKGIHCSIKCYREYKLIHGLTDVQKKLVSEKTKISMNKPEIKEKFLNSYTPENIKKRSLSAKKQQEKIKSNLEQYKNRQKKQSESKVNMWNNMDNSIKNIYLKKLERMRNIHSHKLNTDKRYRADFVKSVTGKNNPFYGKKHKKETIEILRKKSSEILLRRIQNGEVKNFNTKPELLVQSKLKENKIEYIPHFVLENKIYDIFIPKSNTLIEVDGVFWHSKGINYDDMNIHQKRRYENDMKKNNIAEKNGYKLIRVWEDEINIFNPLEVI
jgi:G:T-mismatch repair DNA endonuclease (very short patch repair protein)